MITVTRDMLVEAIAKVGSQACNSIGSDGCIYRGPNGSKCIVGHLIPDDVSIRWDGYAAAGGVVVCYCLELDEDVGIPPVFSWETAKVLQKLQASHDEKVMAGYSPRKVADHIMTTLDNVWPKENI